MIIAYSEQEFYKLQAIDIAGQAIINQLDAYVHVEGNMDVDFWKMIFKEFTPELRLNFIWETRSLQREKSSGVYHCLKFKNYLSHQFFICIDSDYRYLLQEEGISASNYIFQTYTYSIENHLCFSTKLNAIPEKCTGIANSVFDFEAFLLAYSNAIYEAFIWHLYFLRNEDVVTFSKDEFNHIISLNGMAGFSINNNGKAIINELISRCNFKTAQLRAAFSQVDLVAERAHFDSLGLKEDNAYLYVRGHNVFDLIVKIGKEVCSQLLSLKKAQLSTAHEISELYAKATPFQRELENVIVFEGYEEINKIKREITQTL